MSYAINRSWSDMFIPAIKRIVGPYLLETSSMYEDRRHATDLLILNARDKRIAARVRRAGYAEKYPYEFTIRCGNQYNAQTEIDKIIQGFGDWMFYGHSAEDVAGKITRWMLIDLAIFRAALIRKDIRDEVKREQRANGDGTSFIAFDVRSFPREILVASSHEIQFAKALTV
jgi:hypothetical protein